MFNSDVLRLEPSVEVARIAESIRLQVRRTLRRRGAVVGISGGVDSSVVAALCAEALGRDRVLGLMMPERSTSDESLELGDMLVRALGIKAEIESVAAGLDAVRCYAEQEAAIRTAVPGYGKGYRCKLALPSLLAGARLNVTRLTVQAPSGETQTVRMTPQAYLQLVAATNYKQRIRKMTEYYHADRLNYAVAGTPNRLEYDQGFFVKQGDGSADFKPIAHLYKTQVYQLAEYLGVPETIRQRPPTTETFSMPQTQEEFYFALPYARMDLCLYAYNHGISPEQAAPVVELSAEQVELVYRDIAAKRRATQYLHARPLLCAPVMEV